MHIWCSRPCSYPWKLHHWCTLFASITFTIKPVSVRQLTDCIAVWMAGRQTFIEILQFHHGYHELINPVLKRYVDHSGRFRFLQGVPCLDSYVVKTSNSSSGRRRHKCASFMLLLQGLIHFRETWPVLAVKRVPSKHDCSKRAVQTTARHSLWIVS